MENILGQGAKFWWWGACVCTACLKLLAVNAVDPNSVKSPYMNVGR
jgi:hypothetical protein